MKYDRLSKFDHGDLFCRPMVKLRLEKVLARKKISKRRFAKLVGVEYSNVFRYFREDYDPKLSVLERWAKILGVRIRDLYEENLKDGPS